VQADSTRGPAARGSSKGWEGACLLAPLRCWRKLERCLDVCMGWTGVLPCKPPEAAHSIVQAICREGGVSEEGGGAALLESLRLSGSFL